MYFHKNLLSCLVGGISFVVDCLGAWLRDRLEESGGILDFGDSELRFPKASCVWFSEADATVLDTPSVA